MKKIIIIIIFLVFIILVLISKVLPNILIMDKAFYGFKKQEEFTTKGFSDFGTIVKYFYDEKIDKKIEKSNDYQLVGKNADLIKNKISQLYEEYNELIFEYNFDMDIIDENDYYILECIECRDFYLYFYDVDTHVLYYIACAV